MGGFEAAAFYLGFVFFTQVALLNILTGIFVEHAMKLAEPDREGIYAQQQKAHLKEVKELENIIDLMNLDTPGYITYSEFLTEMQDPKSKLRVYLGSLGV